MTKSTLKLLANSWSKLTFYSSK